MSDTEVLFNAHTHHFREGEIGIVQLSKHDNSVLPPYFSVGIHPENAASILTDEFDWIIEMIQHPGCLALGEIGLDTRYTNTQTQEKSYILQLEIAKKYNKPVILHCVNSWERCKFLHQKHAATTPLIFHGFNKTRIIKQVLEYVPSVISLGSSLQTNKSLQDTVQQIPLNRILLETDNQPDELKENYRLLAELKNISLQTLINELSQNAKHIFNYE